MVKKRAHWKSYSVEENLAAFVKPIVDQKSLGFTSASEFYTQAIREKVERYVHLGLHPWSQNRKPDDREGKLRTRMSHPLDESEPSIK